MLSWGMSTFSRFLRSPRHPSLVTVVHCLRAEEAVREAAALDPESVEARDLLRCLLGNENCRRKEMRIQVGQPSGEPVQAAISETWLWKGDVFFLKLNPVWE